MISPIDQYLATLREELSAATHQKLAPPPGAQWTPGALKEIEFIDQSVREVSSHLREHADHLIKQGSEPMQAERQATTDFGSPKRIARALNEKRRKLVSAKSHLLIETFMLLWSAQAVFINSRPLDDPARWLSPAMLLPTTSATLVIFFALPFHKFQPRYLVMGGVFRTAVSIACLSAFTSESIHNRLPYPVPEVQWVWFQSTIALTIYWIGVLVYSQAQNKRMKLAGMVK